LGGEGRSGGWVAGAWRIRALRRRRRSAPPSQPPASQRARRSRRRRSAPRRSRPRRRSRRRPPSTPPSTHQKEAWSKRRTICRKVTILLLVHRGFGRWRRRWLGSRGWRGSGAGAALALAGLPRWRGVLAPAWAARSLGPTASRSGSSADRRRSWPPSPEVLPASLRPGLGPVPPRWSPTSSRRARRCRETPAHRGTCPS